jgi:hypothetical protein
MRTAGVSGEWLMAARRRQLLSKPNHQCACPGLHILGVCLMVVSKRVMLLTA